MVSPIGTKASEEQCYMGTYHSTRGRTLSCSSKVAIRTGIAPDGGLFVSDELGTQQVDISSLADKSYFEIAQDVLGMLLNDYTAEEISACVDEAYRARSRVKRLRRSSNSTLRRALTPLRPM